jgi:hypothetical protein
MVERTEGGLATTGVGLTPATDPALAVTMLASSKDGSDGSVTLAVLATIWTMPSD